MSLTLVLGGASSGKSDYGEELAKSFGRPVTYLATADAKDEEMADKIEQHRKRRPPEWGLWEGEPRELPSVISSLSGVLLLDCLTMLLTRLFFESGISEKGDAAEWRMKEKEIAEIVSRICKAPKSGTELIIVSSEVGFGLVPPYLMGRRFRDIQGRMNRLCASYAERAVLVVAGCPLRLK